MSRFSLAQPSTFGVVYNDLTLRRREYIEKQ